MIKFEKVSYEEFLKSIREQFGAAIPDENVKEIYNNLKLPQRGTFGSAGYDFFCPIPLDFYPNLYQVIPTGIRFVTDREDIVLCLVPRSGLGFKYGAKLRNTCGIIDSDFQYSDNGGHIMVKMAGDKPFTVEEGKAFCQGIILPYLITDDDSATASRNGGFGSTGA